jgi:hypothetical protein
MSRPAALAAALFTVAASVASADPILLTATRNVHGRAVVQPSRPGPVDVDQFVEESSTLGVFSGGGAEHDRRFRPSTLVRFRRRDVCLAGTGRPARFRGDFRDADHVFSRRADARAVQQHPCRRGRGVRRNRIVLRETSGVERRRDVGPDRRATHCPAASGRLPVVGPRAIRFRARVEQHVRACELRLRLRARTGSTRSRAGVGGIARVWIDRGGLQARPHAPTSARLHRGATCGALWP